MVEFKKFNIDKNQIYLITLFLFLGFSTFGQGDPCELHLDPNRNGSIVLPDGKTWCDVARETGSAYAKCRCEHGENAATDKTNRQAEIANMYAQSEALTNKANEAKQKAYQINLIDDSSNFEAEKQTKIAYLEEYVKYTEQVINLLREMNQRFKMENNTKYKEQDVANARAEINRIREKEQSKTLTVTGAPGQTSSPTQTTSRPDNIENSPQEAEETQIAKEGQIKANEAAYPAMVLVEGGTFTMGTEVYWYGTHQVSLKSFKISKNEVTVQQYRTFCQATGKPMPKTPDWGWQDNHPIVNVSWHDAVAYCEWLSEKQGDHYRLPTEAEWEYAARGGKKSKGYKYSGSDDLDSICSEEDQTYNVGQKKPNELGLFDMTGNALEWCADWFDIDYYSNSPGSNPLGPNNGGQRVNRGGDWTDHFYHNADNLTVYKRRSAHPDVHYDYIGFRVVLSQ